MTKIPTLGWARIFGALEESHSVSINRWSELLFQPEFQSYYQSRFYRNNLFIDNRKSSYFSADKMAFWLELRLTKKFFLLGFWKSDVRFSKTYLPSLSYYVRFCLRYLPTQKSDILYGRSLRPYFVNQIQTINLEK